MIVKMTAAEYHALDAISASLLKAARKGAPHLARYRSGEQTFGPAVALGTAAHSMILTPADFDAEIAVAPDVNRRTKEGKAAHAAWLETVGDRTVITAEQHEAARRIAEAVAAHPLASDLLSDCETEVTLVWDGCKARIDAIKGSTLIDLKTTRDASPATFSRAIFNRDIHLQLAWYADALAEVGRTVDRYVVIAVDNVDPYGVAVYELDEHAIELGRRAYCDALAMLDHNPANGYAATAIPVEVPRWIK